MVSPQYNAIAQKVYQDQRLSPQEALLLYRCGEFDFLASLADFKRRQINKEKVFFNQNFHIEPSNVCIHRCKFCSYRRDHIEDKGSWTRSIEEMCTYAQEKYYKGITEVHIVGSVHPNRDIHFYAALLEALRSILPAEVSIKAFSAVEIDGMCNMAGMSWAQGLQLLKERGLDALPGGGAEIFAPELRAQICPDKASAKTWLDIHDTAHRLHIQSNATMLFGHLETLEQRIDHLEQIRQQQDRSGGFTAFIPLKYRSANNELSNNGEVGILETLRQFAVARLYLDNIPHIKAYWPMLGKEATQLALLYGADDLDGTIQDSTRIYSMAGAEEQHPGFTKEALCKLIEAAGFRPVERDSFYQEV